MSAARSATLLWLAYPPRYPVPNEDCHEGTVAAQTRAVRDAAEARSVACGGTVQLVCHQRLCTGS